MLAILPKNVVKKLYQTFMARVEFLLIKVSPKTMLCFGPTEEKATISHSTKMILNGTELAIIFVEIHFGAMKASLQWMSGKVSSVIAGSWQLLVHLLRSRRGSRRFS